MVVDCHVNIWNHDQVTSLWRAQMTRVRPDGAPGLLADADTLFEAMENVYKAIVFPIRYGDSAGVESDDETCAAHDLPLTTYIGTTFARNAPVELGRAIHVEPIAIRHPYLKMICAHMGHPWHEETIAVVRTQPKVYCDLGAVLPAVAVLEHPGLRAGLPNDRQDFLRHRLPIFRGGGKHSGTAQRQ